MGAAAERVRSLASDAGDTLSHFADRGQAAARDLYDHGHAAASGMRDRAGGAVGQVRDMGSRTVDYVQDQPLVLGALGITVGAVIGMLVPSTRYERRVVGSLRDSLGDTAREVAGRRASGWFVSRRRCWRRRRRRPVVKVWSAPTGRSLRPPRATALPMSRGVRAMSWRRRPLPGARP